MTDGIDLNVFDMTDRRVLITGAAGGIGSAMARSFSAHGATLVLADRNQTGLDELATSVGGNPPCLAYDQSIPKEVEKLAAAAGPIDILLNNAGILAMSPLQEQSTEEITQLIAINLTGPILLATALAKGMIARGRGVIVNTASQLAFTGAMDRSVYSTTKAGLVQFTRTAAAEWARYGVRVVALAPGPTETPMIKEIIDTPEGRAQRLDKIPMQRFGTAEEMARLALVLASNLSDNVTGHTLVADGGYVAAS
jgi:NAD(P)-dependent dehydrogenase (short-subunit alcohol dehydrogenase family)